MSRIEMWWRPTRVLCLLGAPLAGCASPEYVRECAREHGRIRVEDYLAEQGLESCPGTPEESCGGRILTPEAVACANDAMIDLERMDYEFGYVEGLAFTSDPGGREGLAWYSFLAERGSNGDRGIIFPIWADTGANAEGGNSPDEYF